jgi:uncharacterized nucleotidyltransferase DUF6036
MNPDFRDLLAAFNARGVEFLIVGAYALAAHGFVRATKDLDVWVKPESSNANRVLAALNDFGAPLHDLSVDDLAHPGLIFQIGVDPIRIDVITSIDGVTFSDGWEQRISARFADQAVPVLSREHLLANKRASGRAQDLVDVKWLEKNTPEKSKGDR